METTQNELLGIFPEDAYPPSEKLSIDYRQRVVRGYQNMSQTTAVICGLARNIESILPQTIVRMEHLGCHFQDYRVVIYENDSADGTVDLLRQWEQSNPKVAVCSERLGMPINPGIRCMDRVERMAIVRNKLRAKIVDGYASYPYTIIIDADLPGGWSYDGIAHSFSHSDWDMVGSNGMLTIVRRRTTRIVHFDAWAFRTPGHPEPMEGREVNPLVFSRGEPLVPMLSCFGGLGLYRTEAIASAEYKGGDCEHVPFHLGMAKAGYGRIYLNPSQIVLYGMRSW